jgi:hypothetical protein
MTTFKDYLVESTAFDLIVPKGKELYHGTIEQFEKEKLSPGIDKVFWTSISKDISRSYIPVSGSSVFLTTDSIVKPSEDPSIQNMQKLLDINYDYDTVEFKLGRPVSYKLPTVFEKFSSIERNILRQMMQLDNIKKELYKKLSDYTAKDFEEISTKYTEIENEYSKVQKAYYENLADTKKREYVNTKMQELGYKPESTPTNGDYHWKIHLDNDTPKPQNWKATGRLITVVPKRDLRFYDMTQGETIESDLTDLQYKKYDLFDKLEKSGYDGLKIADFAQHEKQGNVGHYSYGLFKSALKDLDVTEEESTHPDEL